MSAEPFPTLEAAKSGPVDVTCQCQKIKITIPSLPEFANLCDCDICFKYGVAWGYFDPSLVAIQDKPVTLYASGQEEDKDTSIIHYTRKNHRIAFGHCASCGTTLYWKLSKSGAADEAARGLEPEIGINMKLLGPEIFKTLRQVCLNKKK